MEALTKEASLYKSLPRWKTLSGGEFRTLKATYGTVHPKEATIVINRTRSASVPVCRKTPQKHTPETELFVKNVSPWC